MPRRFIWKDCMIINNLLFLCSLVRISRAKGEWLLGGYEFAQTTTNHLLRQRQGDVLVAVVHVHIGSHHAGDDHGRTGLCLYARSRRVPLDRIQQGALHEWSLPNRPCH